MNKSFNLTATMRFSKINARYVSKIAIIICLFLVNSSLLLAQDSLLVTGTIYTGSNKPLPNVSVSIEGSFQEPVVTNENGEFSIKASSGNAWLFIAPAADYKNKRVLLNNRSSIRIVLTSNDLLAGDDELVILNQPKLRKNIISSYTELRLDKLLPNSALSIDQYMQGVIPGAYIVSGSGMPGSAANINIRGITSINTSNQPLIIVDGVPITPQGTFNSMLAGYDYNQLLAINPIDVSRVLVIKDQATLAAYGTNGSNGAILIETLDPQATETTIDIDFKTGLSLTPAKDIPQLSAFQHKTFMQEIVYSSGMLEEDIRLQYPSLFYTPEDEGYIDYQHNTNWQSIIFDNARFNTINFSIKGGDEIARYGLSFGYTNNKGIIKNTNFQGYNLRFVSKMNIFRWLKLNASVSLNYGDANLREAALSAQTSPIMASLAKSPLLNPYRYDINGNEVKILAEVDEIGVSNPQAIIDNFSAKNHNYNFIAAADFESVLNKYISVKTKFGLTYNVLKEEIYWPTGGMDTYYEGEAINVSKASNNDIQTFYNNTYFYFHKQIGSNQFFTSSTGFNLQVNNFQYDLALTKNSNENDKYRRLQSGQDALREIGGQNRDWNWFSIYENLFYSLNDKYLFTASASLDMSSRLGKNAINTVKLNGVPFGFFYSGGLAWRISNEPFLNDLSWLEELKLRVSYGKSGNSDIGESSAANFYRAIKFRETVGYVPYVTPNDKLSFETVTQLNTGIDIALMGNRFSASVDIFNSRTENMLIYTPVEKYVGYEVVAENGGELINKGMELKSFLRIIDNPAFKWDLGLNVSTIQNELKSIKGGKYVIDIEGAQIVNMVGAPANSYYGYIYKGVYATQQEADAANLKNIRDVKFQAGDAIYEDLSGPQGTPDGVINDYDKTAIGSMLPSLYGGFINNFTWKNWSLGTFIQLVSGNDVFNYVRYRNERMVDLSNQSDKVLNRWQYSGQVTDVPRALWNDPVGNSAFSTRWIEDGSFIRIKNITLSYTVPNKFLAFRNAQVYVSAINIFTFSKYLGYDPEFAYSYSQFNQGIDYGQTPQPRQFMVGVKIGL